MQTKLLEFVLVLASSIFCSTTTSAANYNFEPNVRIWETNVLPGQLLQTLDRVTSDTQRLLHSSQPTTRTVATPLQPQAAIQRRAELSSGEDTYTNTNTNTEEAEGDGGAAEAYNYDRAYEEFVRRYFGRSAKDADTAAVEEEDYDEEPIPEASSTQKCRKVRRKHQDCEICRNSRNGEKSETCSYSTESEPQRYSYGKERNYRSSRNSQDDSNESESAEPDAATFEADEIEANNDVSQEKPTKASKTVAGRNENSAADVKDSGGSSSCIKKTQRHKVCYYCERNDGEKMAKCYARNTASKSPPLAGSGGGNGSAKAKKAHKVQKTQQRIYKRTVTHSSWREGQ